MQSVGKYQLVRKLATGGMAEVFLARAEGPGGFSKKLVVKRILPHFVSDPTFAAMFLSEARLAAELNHPNIVQIFDFGQADGQYYLAMEFIDGANLRVLNAAATADGARIPLALVARLVSQAAEGLHFAHELHGEDGKHIGLIHRDISPDNILVSRSGAVKVVDFGIAKSNTQTNTTRSGVIKGKMAYMPPEQLGRKSVDRRVDIFALGVVLHELVTGTWPFDASSEVSIIQAIMNEVPFTLVRERRADTPEALERIIARCLEKNRDHRYATCKELQADLENFIAGSGQPVHAGDLADLVNRLVPPPPASEISQPIELGDLEGTFKRQLKAGESGNSLPRVGEERAPAKGRAGLAAGVTLGVALAVAATWFFSRPSPVADPRAPRPDAVTPVEAIVPVPVEAAIVDGGPAPVEPLGVVEPRPAPVLAVTRLLKIEFRIRPFAQVFLDGKDLGQTPFPAVSVAAGKHRIRLVNEQLGKKVEVDQVFKAGDTSFKYNLKE